MSVIYIHEQIWKSTQTHQPDCVQAKYTFILPGSTLAPGHFAFCGLFLPMVSGRIENKLGRKQLAMTVKQVVTLQISVQTMCKCD